MQLFTIYFQYSANLYLKSMDIQRVWIVYKEDSAIFIPLASLKSHNVSRNFQQHSI